MKKFTFVSLTLIAMQFCFVNLQAQNLLKIGDQIPEFYLLDQYGREFNSLDYVGKQPLVIFFYTEDDSETCTKQICLFRDNYPKFKNLNAKIIGINPGYLYYHTLFANKNKIPYTILADKNNYVQKKFGVPNVKRTSNPKRYTFIIDNKGIIRHIYHNKKNVESHIEIALRTLNNNE